MTGVYHDPAFTDAMRLESSRRLRAITEARVDAALLALDPSRPELLRAAVEVAELRQEIGRLRAELEARRLYAPTITGPGPNGTTVAVSDDGRTWEVSR